MVPVRVNEALEVVFLISVLEAFVLVVEVTVCVFVVV
jgi:hypothetical protein